MLGDMLNHVKPERAFESLHAPLQSVLAKILAHSPSIAYILTSMHTRTCNTRYSHVCMYMCMCRDVLVVDKFLAFVDLFTKDSVKSEVCKSIIDAFNTNQSSQTDNSVVTNILVYIGKVQPRMLACIHAYTHMQYTLLTCMYVYV